MGTGKVEAPQGCEDFDQGAAKKYVIDPPASSPPDDVDGPAGGPHRLAGGGYLARAIASRSWSLADLRAAADVEPPRLGLQCLARLRFAMRTLFASMPGATRASA
jgi:hypothetical protein